MLCRFRRWTAMGGGRGGGRTSPVLGKKSLSRALVKKVTELTPPRYTKNKWSMANIGHDVERTCIVSKLAVDCQHRWQQRPWQMSPLGGVFLCVCVSVTVVQNLWFFTHGHMKVVQTTKPLTKKGCKYDAMYDHAVVELLQLISKLRHI